MRNLLYIIFIFATFSISLIAQNPSSIKQRCPSPFGSTYGNITVQASGNINYTPCPNESNIFYRDVDFTNATITGLDLSALGGVTGSGTTNFIPRFTNGASGIIGNTPFSWNGTIYNFNNTALTCTFCLNFTPGIAGAGSFAVGAVATDARLSIDSGAGGINIMESLLSTTINTKGGLFIAGDSGGIANATKIQLNDSTSAIDLISDGVIQIGDVNGSGGSTLFAVNDNVPAFIFNTGIFRIVNDCAGIATLNGSGEFDLAGTACWSLLQGTPVILVTSQDATGILRVDVSGLLISSAGAADTNRLVYYWIIDT